MAEPLPKWLMSRYAVLWKAHHTHEFSHDDASYALQDERRELVSVILSGLKRHGWLAMRLDPFDSRKRLYSIKDPRRVVNELGNRHAH
jgi:hypothetical protein